jgi:dynein heavy chain
MLMFTGIFKRLSAHHMSAGGGKSVIINTLARAQTRLGRRTTLHVVNPKAISVSELYGILDKDTRDWTDGLLSNIFR